MKIRHTLLILLFFILIKIHLPAQIYFYPIPLQHFTLNYEKTIDLYYTIDPYYKTESFSNGNYNISQLITLKEYKSFLKNIKAEVHDTIYKNLLPNKRSFTKQNYKTYIEGNEYNEYPVVGISWYSVLEYCKWKTLTENGDSIVFIYRPPTRKEWIVSRQFFKEMENGHDFGIYLSEWMYDPYDKYYSFSPEFSEFNGKNETDQSSIEAVQHLIMGSSFHIHNKDMNLYGMGHSSNRGSNYVGFRCIRVEVTKLAPDFEKLPEVFKKMPKFCLLNYWDLWEKIASKTSTDVQNHDLYGCSELIYTEENCINYSYHKKSDKLILKKLGRFKDNKKYGNWYFWDNKGKLKKHVIYNNDKPARIKPIETPNSFEYKIPDQNFKEFTDSLKSITHPENNTIDKYNFSYQMRNGKMNGYFQYDMNYYSKNGTTVTGCYNENLKTGTWRLWSQEKELLAERKYQTGNVYTRTYSIYPENKLTALFNMSHPEYEKNANNENAYKTYDKSDILWSKDIWRRLTPKENPLIFEDINLLDTLLYLIKQKHVMAYEFSVQEEYKKISFKRINKIYNKETHKICEYIIKETNICDRKSAERECRVIDIAPVICNLDGSQKIELFQIPISIIQDKLAQIKLPNQTPEHIKTMNDLFYYRYYCGPVYAESNAYNSKKLSSYLANDILIREETQRIEMHLLELEFKMWHYFNKKFVNQ